MVSFDVHELGLKRVCSLNTTFYRLKSFELHTPIWRLVLCEKGLNIIETLNLDNDPHLPIAPEIYKRNINSGLNYLYDFEKQFLSHSLSTDLLIPVASSGKWYLAQKAFKTVNVWYNDLNNDYIQLKLIEKSKNINSTKCREYIRQFSGFMTNYFNLLHSTPYLASDVRFTQLKHKAAKDQMIHCLEIVSHCLSEHIVLNGLTHNIIQQTYNYLEQPQLLQNTDDWIAICVQSELQNLPWTDDSRYF